ncbi:MAG: hypothetical protein IJQ39_07655 [Thermoguttaceae bacterium]|nr:hypothetical protein [Thermoguttaceae bacterium]
MFYQFRFDLLFLFVFIALLILNMTMGDANKSDVQTANAVTVEAQNNTASDNPVVKN